uniref:Uncharacterized protein n=2 Tax=Ciona intestinalis TaxID=7719 RepID=H2XXU5_CIOIN
LSHCNKSSKTQGIVLPEGFNQKPDSVSDLCVAIQHLQSSLENNGNEQQQQQQMLAEHSKHLEDLRIDVKELTTNRTPKTPQKVYIEGASVSY